jgi:hypothetical protein
MKIECRRCHGDHPTLLCPELLRDRMTSGLNYQPICDAPQDARISNGAGYRMCSNPAHLQEPDYAQRGPVWHKISEWPEGKC